jgi:hypothetical protein
MRRGRICPCLLFKGCDIMYKWMITLGLFVVLVGCNGTEETKTDIKQEKPKVSKQENPKVQEQPTEQQVQPTEETKPEEPKQESKQSNTPVQEAVKPKAPKPEPEPVSPPPSSAPVPSTPSTLAPPPPKPAEPVKQAESVFLSIRGAGKTILGKTEVELENGDTVFSVLARTVKKKGIQMEYSGTGASIYVEGIDNLYEKDKGPLSGWIYKRNGVHAKTGAGKTAVKTGDVIEWVYTVDGENP